MDLTKNAATPKYTFGNCVLYNGQKWVVRKRAWSNKAMCYAYLLGNIGLTEQVKVREDQIDGKVSQY